MSKKTEHEFVIVDKAMDDRISNFGTFSSREDAERFLREFRNKSLTLDYEVREKSKAEKR